MNQKTDFFYFKITDLWKKLCEQHASLLDYTFDEYSFLLGSDVEKLEETVKDKIVIVKKIEGLDKLRRGLIDEINREFPNSKIKNIKDLLLMMKQHNFEKNYNHLSKFNALLEDIIKKIQTQNKKNQLFINRALVSLKGIREESLGEKNYSVYNAKGTEKQKNTST